MYYEETANANPAVAIILGVVLLGENLNGTFLVGLGTLVVGVVFLLAPGRPPGIAMPFAEDYDHH